MMDNTKMVQTYLGKCPSEGRRLMVEAYLELGEEDRTLIDAAALGISNKCRVMGPRGGLEVIWQLCWYLRERGVAEDELRRELDNRDWRL